MDIGESTIEVQLRDGLHAAEGSYDDLETVNFTIEAAAGTGIGTEPEITSITPSLASPQPAGVLLDFICTATDTEEDAVIVPIFSRPAQELPE